MATTFERAVRGSYRQPDRAPEATRVRELLAVLAAQGRPCGVALVESSGHAGYRLALPADRLRPRHVARLALIVEPLS